MRLLSSKDLREIKGISFSKQHLWRLIYEKRKFPRPIKLAGGKRNAWLENEIDEYIARRIAERDTSS